MRAFALVLVAAFALSGCLSQIVGGPSPYDYLRGSTFTKWTIEVDYATGHQPSSELLGFLHDRLAAVVNKPDGVEFQLGQSLGDSQRTWDQGSVQAYANDHATLSTNGNTVVLHLLFLAGHYDPAGVLGVTFGHGLIVIFSEDVDAMCNGALIPGTCSEAAVYHSVVLHELGHALGLVNNGIPMVNPHEANSCDLGNGNVKQNDHGHSTDSKSVMTCAVEQASSLGQLLTGTPPDSFDQADRDDMHAAGGK